MGKLKRIMAAMLAVLIMAAALPHAYADAPPGNLPEWRLLVAIYPHVDADCRDEDGVMRRAKYDMPDDEVAIARENAAALEKFLDDTGVIDAAVDVIVIPDTITQLDDVSNGSYFSVRLSEPYLRKYVDLDRYDQVTNVMNLNVSTYYWGKGGTSYSNGTGYAVVNFESHSYATRHCMITAPDMPCRPFVHELLHFLEYESVKWGLPFDLHGSETLYPDNLSGWRKCYEDLFHRAVQGEYGPGPAESAFELHPTAIRAMDVLDVPDGSKQIRRQAFRNLEGLESASVPGTVESIGYGAFSGCTGLESVSISDGVEWIDAFAFDGCSSLVHLELPSHMDLISQCAFRNCSSLESAILPEGLKSLPNFLFGYDYALTEVYIPASVESIGYAAFYGAKMKDVYFGGTEAQWKAIKIDRFNECLAWATVHYNVTPERIDPQATPMSGQPPQTGPDGKQDASADRPWYADAVDWAWSAGILDGTGFDADNVSTRAQVVYYLWAMAGYPEPAGGTTFEDVPAGAWYEKAVNWAYNAGIVSGKSASVFDPGGGCTRAEAMTLLYRTQGSPETAYKGAFDDVPEGAWYAIPCEWAAANGIAVGTGGGKFSPTLPCTGAQIVTLIRRCLAG